MTLRTTPHTASIAGTLLLICGLVLSSCASVYDTAGKPAVAEKTDLSCSYFYFLWGTHAEYEGRFDEAADAYQKALVCDPSARYIMHKLPLVHLKSGDTDQAITELSNNIQGAPDDNASRMLLARLYVQQKQFNRAIAQYEAVLDSDPGHEQALLRLGILLDQDGKTDLARAELTRLISLHPDSYLGNLAMARIAKSPDEAVTYYMRALELNRSVELYSEITQFHIDRKEFDQAVALLTNALADAENNEQLRLLLALALLGQESDDAAVAELGLLPQYQNNPTQLTMVLSKLYVRLDNHQMAIKHLQELLAAREDPAARYLLGVIYSDLDQYDDALRTLESIGPEYDQFEDAVFLQAKMLRQSNSIDASLALLDRYLSAERTTRPMFYVIAASLYKESNRQEQALDVIKEGFSHYPEDEDILFEYGLLLEQSGRIEGAIEIMELLLEVNPDHAEALNFVGYTWADTNRNLDKALAYIERAVELRPGNGYIQDSLGWVHFRLGNLERAKEELLHAIQLVPDDPHIYDHLGDVYRALGDRRKAAEYYRQAFDLFDTEDNKNEIQNKIDALQKR